MNRFPMVFAAVVSGVLSVACGVSVRGDSSSVTYGDTGWDGDAFQRVNDLGVDHTLLRGALGGVADIAHEATAIASVDYFGFSQVDLTTEVPGGAAMVMVEVLGGLDHDELAPGAVRTYGLNAPREDTDVDVVGCSGPEVEDWEFDERADEVTVRISALPSGRRRMDVAATWKDGLTGAPLHHLDTSFEYTVPDHRTAP